MAEMRRSLSHLNGNLLCAIDVETTGFIPGHHEVYEIAIIPLDCNFKPNKAYKPLNISVIPDHADRIDWGGMSLCGNKKRLEEVLVNGLFYEAATNLIDRWFGSLQLINKRIAPLTHNGVFDLSHLQAFLGNAAYSSMINASEVRDTMYLARMLNDLADLKIQNFPYAKVDLKFLCSCLKIDSEKYGKRHSAFVDAILTAEVYETMMRNLKHNSTL